MSSTVNCNCNSDELGEGTYKLDIDGSMYSNSMEKENGKKTGAKFEEKKNPVMAMEVDPATGLLSFIVNGL